jgi:pimeloyl-ACP methyl ester carboxylesterase
MPTVEANGINIYYEISGEGEPLVLISGLGYGLWQWHKMIPQLAEHFKVIAFDNRGAGNTDKPPGPYSAKMMADDTAGLLKAIDVNQAIVVGHSMGGFIAQELTLSYPELVSKLVLTSTNFGGPNHIPVTPEAMAVLMDQTGDPVERVRRGAAVAFNQGFDKDHPEVVEEITQYRLSEPVPQDAYQAQLAVGLGLLSIEACFENRLSEVAVPTYIIFGAGDRVTPPGNAELLAEKIPDSTVHILPDVGHLFTMENPDLAAKTLIDLLKS